MTIHELAEIAFETHNSRDLNAQRETVFDAFAKPELLAQWWGPKGFTITIEKFDFRAGGEWVFVMHGPDGQNYPNRKKFVEIERPSRIVFRHIQAGHDFLMTMTFQDLGNKTRLTWDMQFESDGDNPALKGFILSANEENFDKLGDLLRQSSEV
jgi:uncharacterized protein YndB with AHSA1/START domain